jgi:BlaI family penicillinase repressor
MGIPKLSALELKILESLWNQGRLSIREIQEAFPEDERPAYTTIQTTVYRLEEKGATRRVRKIGNAHIFEAAISRRDARGGFLDNVLDLVGSPQFVMAHMVKTGKLSLTDLQDAEKLLQELSRDRKKEGHKHE